MSLVLMNILAYLAIITLLGFFGVIAAAVLMVQRYIRTGKAAMAMVAPVRQTISSEIATVNAIALKCKSRGLAMYGHVRVAADSVIHVKDELVLAVKSIDIEGMKTGAKNAAEFFANRGGDEANLIREFVKTLLQANAAQKQ